MANTHLGSTRSRPAHLRGKPGSASKILIGSAPVERDVLGRIQRVLEFEAVRVDCQNRRLPPRDELRSGPGFAARRVDQLGILPGRTGRSADRLGPGLDLVDDLDAPMAKIGRNLITDFGSL